jgi:hypothetical protein
MRFLKIAAAVPLYALGLGAAAAPPVFAVILLRSRRPASVVFGALLVILMGLLTWRAMRQRSAGPRPAGR